MADFAPGIPRSRAIRTVPTNSRKRNWDLAIQVHVANRAGRHLDLRLSPAGGQRAYSWALRRWPGPGDKVLAVVQPTHRRQYMSFSGRIDSGYGAGTVSLARRERAEVLSSSPGHVRFNLYPGNRVEEYLLKATGGKNWLLMNVTPTRAAKSLPDYKPKYRSAAYGSMDVSDPDVIVQAKLSGAHVLVDLRGARPRVYSYRQGRRLIQHSPKIPGLPAQTPPGLRGAVLRAELVAPGLPEQTTGGLLNSGVWKSREKQKKLRRGLRLYVLDVVTWRGKDVESLAHGQKLEFINLALELGRGWLHRPRTAYTAGAKAALMSRIAGGREPTTDEGVVAWRLGDNRPTKMKLRDEVDVWVRDVFTVSNPDLAAGFSYSLTKSGPVAGRVSSGLDRATRLSMARNPEGYRGLAAKVSGARGGVRGPGRGLQKPVFLSWHLDQELPRV